MRGKDLILAIFMGVILPSMMFTVAEKLLPTEKVPSVQGPSAAEQTQAEISPPVLTDHLIAVLQADGTIYNMELETYLVGVVLGEMPLSFNIEALKAQAVVARTYTLRRSTVSKKHPGGAVCVNSACCQAYCAPEVFGSKVLLEKAKTAVSETAGQVVTYNGALIEATYFSCSGGRTEDAVAVWGEEVPYLQAVDSPGEESAAHYTDTINFTAEEFARRLGLSGKGDPAMWIGSETYTAGGGVDKITIAGKVFRGTELRQKLELPSTLFSVTAAGDVVKIVTKGFGHRVGMSQYGAEAMAANGSSYREILTHYYPGTSLTDY